MRIFGRHAERRAVRVMEFVNVLVEWAVVQELMG